MNFIVAGTARTSKSVTVTQLSNITVQHLGRTAGTDDVSVGAGRSTANQPERCRQASCSRVGQRRPGRKYRTWKRNGQLIANCRQEQTSQYKPVIAKRCDSKFNMRHSVNLSSVTVMVKCCKTVGPQSYDMPSVCNLRRSNGCVYMENIYLRVSSTVRQSCQCSAAICNRPLV